MTVSVDRSALIERDVEEAESETAEALLGADPDWVTARHSYVEIILALHRRLADDARRAAMAAFEADWDRMYLVALDETVCRRAAELGSMTGTRTLDALHLAAAERAGGRSLPVLTFDVRLAEAALRLGFTVLGV
jgi:predicted nucleic acid-binding protein